MQKPWKITNQTQINSTGHMFLHDISYMDLNYLMFDMKS